MVKRKGIILFMIFLVILTGCSQEKKFEPDTFSKDDLAIIKEDDPKFKLSYGMSKTDVEELLGKPRETNLLGTNYDFGVKIMYRNDKVAGIFLGEESKGIYLTARGAGVGMKKEYIKELYGNRYALDKTEHNLDYQYDSKNKRYIEQWTEGEKPEELEDIYLMSSIFVDGEAINIMVLDKRMGTLMN